MAGFLRLAPLLDQPGERFRYYTGAMAAGILIERVTGAPFAEVLGKRASGPLTGTLFTQRMMTSPEPPGVARDFWSAAHAALA